MIGKAVLHYRILEELGRGGMGVVYRARDTRLDRIVALKFLPTNVVSGEKEKKRFKREAKAAAALNHPNICHIYAIDEADDQMFIAMEFIEGKSLAEMVGANGGSPLQISDAIDYATQIAAGLQAAHEKGITHRDIKSANIMVTPKDRGKLGVVKIMDFGLAKLDNRSMMTKEGTTLGTAAYMSPEQARGEIVDQRTDIWSLGVVLYEMISGRLPFRGEYEQAMVYSILNEEPEPLTALRSGVPIALDGIITKALAKDSAVRYQHVDELPADLKAIEMTSAGRSKISSAKFPAAIEAKSGLRLPWIAAATCLLVALAALTLLYVRQPATPTAAIRSSILLPEESRFTTQFGFGKQFALSPDGSKLAFAATDSSGIARLWVRPLDALSAKTLGGTEGANDPFWSPDNRYIGFFADDKLKKIDVAGGPALTICDAFEARGGTWSKDDLIIFALPASGRLYLVSAAGGTPTALTKLDTARGEIAHRWPGFLPDGKQFVYYAQATEAPNAIFVASLDMKMNNFLVPATSNAAYASGHLLFHRNGTLVAQRLETSLPELQGEAIAIAKQVHYNVTLTDLASFTVSENGMLAYRPGVRQAGSQLLIFDREGKQIGAVAERDNYMGVRLSPDGQKVATDILDSQSRQFDLWLFDLTEDIKTRFTFDAKSDRFPVWSPDGKYLAFHSRRKGVFDIYQKAASGAGSEEVVLESNENKQPLDWSLDGRFISYITYDDPKTSGDVWVLPLFGDRQPIPLLNTESNELYPYFSPDGRWIAYTSDESRQLEVYVLQFPPADAAEQSRVGKWQISTAGGTRPRWRRDGKELFYLSYDNKIMAAAITTTDSTIEVGAVRPLFQTQAATVANNYDVSADGQRFMVNSLVASQSPSSVTLVVNWTEELKKK